MEIRDLATVVGAEVYNDDGEYGLVMDESEHSAVAGREVRKLVLYDPAGYPLLVATHEAQMKQLLDDQGWKLQ